MESFIFLIRYSQTPELHAAFITQNVITQNKLYCLYWGGWGDQIFCKSVYCQIPQGGQSTSADFFYLKLREINRKLIFFLKFSVLTLGFIDSEEDVEFGFLK